MKKKHRMHYYGVLATYNPYDGKWYAFHKSDVFSYFTERDNIVTGLGEDALSAINDYLSKKISISLS
jgi:hypothetical protein